MVSAMTQLSIKIDKYLSLATSRRRADLPDMVANDNVKGKCGLSWVEIFRSISGKRHLEQRYQGELIIFNEEGAQ